MLLGLLGFDHWVINFGNNDVLYYVLRIGYFVIDLITSITVNGCITSII